ncbi:MAG TPA: ribosome silencing factor [Solimonas sp.]|nr:ribosome silencing factor [Solimonas sp.]
MPRLTKLAKLAVKALEDLKGVEIKVLDVMKLTTITDFMIIATGTSSRHVKSLAQAVVDVAKESGERPLGIEGLNEGEWALVDLGSVVVHVMQVQARAHFQLEKLWEMKPAAEREEEAKPKAKKAKPKAKAAAKAKPKKPAAKRPARFKLP